MVEDIKKQINIIAYRGDTSACWYYRIHLPLSFLTRHHHEYQATVVSYMDKRHMGAFDVAILQRQYRPQVFMPMLELKEHGTKLIYEIDDDLFHIPVWNPASNTLGKRSVTESIKKFLGNVDAVFVTTEYLKNVYQEYAEHIYILPNSIAFDAFSPSPDNSKRPVVCWQGSHTHKKDLKIFRNALNRLISDGDVFIKMWSASMSGTYEVPMVEFKGFYQVFSQIDACVGLAPLIPNMFNRSKSNLKFLEYTAQGVATVASDFGSYADTIEHEVTGMLVGDNRDWYDYIRYLVDNDDIRNEMIANARKLVEEEYNLAKNYLLWKNAIDEVLEMENKDEKGIIHARS